VGDNGTSAVHRKQYVCMGVAAMGLCVRLSGMYCGMHCCLLDAIDTAGVMHDPRKCSIMGLLALVARCMHAWNGSALA